MNTSGQAMKYRINELGSAAEVFAEELYLEHLDEVSFLYSQRLNLMKEPYRSWQDMEMIEHRIQAHIEALENAAALDICLEQSQEGAPGVLYAAARVFCRLKLNEPVKEILANLDPMNTSKINAVINALNHDLPVEWHSLIEQMLLSTKPLLIKVATAVIGFRRLPMGNHFVSLLNRPHDETYGNIIRTIGQLRVKPARDHLLHFIRSDEEQDFIKQEIGMALLRLGEKGVFPVLADYSSQNSWIYLAMGLCGGTFHVSYLQEISRSAGICDESLLALGLLGEPSSVDILISNLNGGAFHETASLALHLITGADLYEDVFIPDLIDEDALFEYEREKLRKREPLYPPGGEPGETVNRLSRNPAVWNEWWMASKDWFEPQAKYRYGKPYGPPGILATLESEKNPASLRQLAYEEFVVRYDQDFCFDVSLPVSEQREVINQIKEWVECNGFKL